MATSIWWWPANRKRSLEEECDLQTNLFQHTRFPRDSKKDGFCCRESDGYSWQVFPRFPHVIHIHPPHSLPLPTVAMKPKMFGMSFFLFVFPTSPIPHIALLRILSWAHHSMLCESSSISQRPLIFVLMVTVNISGSLNIVGDIWRGLTRLIRPSCPRRLLKESTEFLKRIGQLFEGIHHDCFMKGKN